MNDWICTFLKNAVPNNSTADNDEFIPRLSGNWIVILDRDIRN